MTVLPIEILASVLFGLAVLHTFCVKRFSHWAHKYPEGSLQENLLHFLAETEVVFGLWAAVLFLGIAVVTQSLHGAVEYIENLNFTEPKFVFVVMVVGGDAAVVTLAEQLITLAARLIPARDATGFYIAALFLGPLLGSFITEPAAMTLLALVLKRRYFDRGISRKLAYATPRAAFCERLHRRHAHAFAAPPVLMVASRGNGTWPSCLNISAGGRLPRVRFRPRSWPGFSEGTAGAGSGEDDRGAGSVLADGAAPVFSRSS